jgi:ABC-type polysaccharide/polyol phosphate transport system ATPase subunit
MDFAEMKRFENMKRINFSSGRHVRLAFATAIEIDPDVILVDEGYSWAMRPSRRSAARRLIDQIKSSGKTILLRRHKGRSR